MPGLLMAMTGRLSVLATEVALRTDRDVAEVIQSIGGRERTEGGYPVPPRETRGGTGR